MNNSVHLGALDLRNFFKKLSAKVTVVGIYITHHFITSIPQLTISKYTYKLNWKRTSTYCMIKCLLCPSENTERTYSPGFPWLSRTKKSPCCFSRSCASILGIAPWYQSCSARGFSSTGIVSQNLSKYWEKKHNIKLEKTAIFFW